MKAKFHIKTNPVVLRWARESIILTKAKAAEELSITTRRLDQLENGARFPALHELKAMSKLYKRSVATLLLKTPPKEKPLPKDCRTIDSGRIGKFHPKTILAVRRARALASSLAELRQEMDIISKPLGISAMLTDNPALVAINSRNRLGLNTFSSTGNIQQVFEGYVERVESFGIAVFQLGLTQDGLRGFSITDDVLPVIVIKRGGELPTTKIFTLFHELGHIVLNQGGLCDITMSENAPRIEKWCNAFAAELLVPSSKLLEHPIVQEHKAGQKKDFLKKDLEEIGRGFHVGPLVILRRLLTHHLTSPKFYSEKHILWNRPAGGFNANPEGRDIPKENLTEKGRGYVSLAFRAFDENHIDLKDLSDFLGVNLSYISKTRQLLNA